MRRISWQPCLAPWHCHTQSSKLSSCGSSYILMSCGCPDSSTAFHLPRRSRPRVRLNKVQAAALRDWMTAYWEPQQQQQQVCGAKVSHARTASQEGQQRASLTGENVFKRVSC
jgi:hypothetical protein